MAIVNGKDALIEAYDGGEWKLFACVRSWSSSISSEMLETTTTGDGRFARFVPGKIGFTVTLEGLINLDTDAGLSLPYLDSCILNGVLLRLRDRKEDLAGNTYAKEFQMYLTDVTDTNSFDNVSTFNADAQGTGVITQTILPPTPTDGLVKRYPLVGDIGPVESGYTVTVPGLGNKDILEVVKDGRGNADIITSGSPVENQVLYETSGTDGVFTWAIPFEDNERWYVTYQDI